MEDNKEKNLVEFPNVVSYESTKKIIEQMEKNIFRIKIGEMKGTGFFCKIPCINKFALITNNHIITENENEINIKIKEENESRIINLENRIKYFNKEYDIAIIEIKDNEIKNYLELDDNIIKDILKNNNKNEEYLDKTIYIIQYPKGELSVSYGILNNMSIDKKYNFNHKCSTKFGSSGSPILNIDNNKIIGMHKGGNNNEGLFLNYPIKEFIKLFPYNPLDEFNKKYNLNIQQDTTKINLESKDIGNEGLKDLCKIEFKELKILCLGMNYISDIKALENAKFEKLEILKLGRNNISDINILEKVNFKKLKSLGFFDNRISDIKVLQNVKFENLQVLDLSNNKISDINILEKVNFKELKKLYLCYNNISDIKVLEKVEFEKLEILDLEENKISDKQLIPKLKLKIKDVRI